MIKITVVTITYNAEHFLRRTLDSVSCQVYPSVEHLIIDGASKDATPDMARDYIRREHEAGSSHEIKLISEPDSGLYDAMNKGLKLATGHYVVFMNAGDCFPDELTLTDVVTNSGIGDLLMTDKPLPAVVYGDTDIVDDSGNFLCRRKHVPPQKLTWRSFRNGMLVCHQAFYARTDIARMNTYDLRYRHSADVDWCIRVMKEAERRNLELVNINRTVANYLREGQSTVFHKASLKERFCIMCRHYGLFTTVAMHLWFIVRKNRRN